MSFSPTRRAALLAAATLTVFTAGCGNAAKPAASTTTPSNTADMPGMVGMIPLVPGADGTSATAGGLRLAAAPTAFQASKAGQLVLQITGKDGKPVTAFDRDQTKLMHLIISRTDFASYQHLHPTLDPATGKFTVALTLPEGGKYHAIADFTTAGKHYALLATLTAAGGTTTQAKLPAVSPSASVDGYDVQLKDGVLSAGKEAPLSFTVTKGGAPVTALQPYLGAAGHLVALRQGDLAYSHVHPVSSNKAAGEIMFSADFPTAASYRLFLQFRAAGVVHTAAFTVAVR